MGLVDQFRAARRGEDMARLRRALAVRAMAATGMSQREIALTLGVSQPAVSQQLRVAPKLMSVAPDVLVEAASPILNELSEERGFSKLAVFGSVARHEAGPDSDVDLMVQEPAGTTIGQLLALREIFERVLGKPVDLITYGGLKPVVDDNIRREAVLL